MFEGIQNSYYVFMKMCRLPTSSDEFRILKFKTWQIFALKQNRSFVRVNSCIFTIWNGNISKTKLLKYFNG